MARVVGYPGSREATIGIRYVLMVAIGGLLAVGLLWHLATVSPAVVVAAGTLIALLVACRLDRSRPDKVFNALVKAMAYLRGSEGERRTAEVLDGLPDDYVVFHSLCFRDAAEGQLRWNIDHVVVGPTGVFAIETKNYSSARVGSAETDNRVRSDVAQVRRNAKDLKRRLKTWSGGKLSDVWVEAVLVYTQDGARTANLREGTTDVIPLRLLRDQVLCRRGRELDPRSAFSVAQVLFDQYPHDVQAKHHHVLRAAGTDWARKRQAAREAGTPPPSVCPQCGAALVEQVARKGPRAGGAFLGCASWPKTGCDFKVDLGG